MNGYAHIVKQFIGKTVEKVEYSDEDYEDTWIIITFTDGTNYKIEANAQHADELWMDIEKIDVVKGDDI